MYTELIFIDISDKNFKNVLRLRAVLSNIKTNRYVNYKAILEYILQCKKIILQNPKCRTTVSQ